MRHLLAIALGTVVTAFASAPAAAADIGLAPPAGTVAMTRSWTGCYAGVLIGYQWGHSRQDYGGLVNGVPNAFMPTGTTMARYRVDGGQVGGTLGCNYQMGSFVFGAEGDLAVVLAQGRSLSDPAAVAAFGLNPNFAFTTDQRVAATLRARLGYATGNWLVYATGGLAYGGFYLNNQNGLLIPTATQDPSYVGKLGWVVGLGVEYSLSANASVKLEGLYIDYGRMHYGDAPGIVTGCTAGCANADVTMRTFVARIGVNYNFMTGPSAIAARY